MWIGSSITSGWHEQNRTFQSRDHAKSQGRLTYNKDRKGGMLKDQIWAATGQVGYVNGQKQFIDRNGILVADIKQMQINKANQVSMELAKKKGWDFYPYFVNLDKRPIEFYGQSGNCHPCKDFANGEIFEWKLWKSDNTYHKSLMTNEYRKIPITYNNSFNGWNHHVSKKSEPVLIKEKYSCYILTEIKNIAQLAWESGMSIRA